MLVTLEAREGVAAPKRHAVGIQALITTGSLTSLSLSLLMCRMGGGRGPSHPSCGEGRWPDRCSCSTVSSTQHVLNKPLQLSPGVCLALFLVPLLLERESHPPWRERREIKGVLREE